MVMFSKIFSLVLELSIIIPCQDDLFGLGVLEANITLPGRRGNN